MDCRLQATISIGRLKTLKKIIEVLLVTQKEMPTIYHSENTLKVQLFLDFFLMKETLYLKVDLDKVLGLVVVHQKR